LPLLLLLGARNIHRTGLPDGRNDGELLLAGLAERPPVVRTGGVGNLPPNGQAERPASSPTAQALC